MSKSEKVIEHEESTLVNKSGKPIGKAIDQSQLAGTDILIAMALEKDLDMDKFERLIQMREHEEEKTAKSLFNTAMAKVQSLIQPIIADAENIHAKDGQGNPSKYAKLVSIIQALAPIYTEHGFSVSYGTSECASQKLIDDGWFRTTSELSHAGGYTKPYHVDLPADIRGPQGTINKTLIHGTKSTITYARGILMGLMFNFVTSDDVDNDGNYAGGTVETITKEQAAAFKDDIEALGGEIEFFCKWLKVDDLEDIPAKKYNIARNEIITQKKLAESK